MILGLSQKVQSINEGMKPHCYFVGQVMTQLDTQITLCAISPLHE